MKLLQMIIHVLDCGFSMVLVQCHKVKIHKVLDTKQGFSEVYPLAGQRVRKSCRENWNNRTPECFPLLTTRLCQLALLRVLLSEARIRRNHRSELVEFVHHGMSLDEGHYQVHQMYMRTQINTLTNIEYDNSGLGDAICIGEDAFWCSNRSIFHRLSFLPSLGLISQSPEHHLLEV